ncbi:hypothetical protein C8J56DRAFT_1068083 [Mycena floridula]|nr:hypothetical protein C8J56DRAFT_1068083 [Mycena floridula]
MHSLDKFIWDGLGIPEITYGWPFVNAVPDSDISALTPLQSNYLQRCGPCCATSVQICFTGFGEGLVRASYIHELDLPTHFVALNLLFPPSVLIFSSGSPMQFSAMILDILKRLDCLTSLALWSTYALESWMGPMGIQKLEAKTASSAAPEQIVECRPLLVQIKYIFAMRAACPCPWASLDYI